MNIDEKLTLQPVDPGAARDPGKNDIVVDSLLRARAILTNPHVQASLFERGPLPPPVNAAQALVARGIELRATWMRGLDPERHAAIRKQISRAVDSEALAWLTQAWTARAKTLLRHGTLRPHFDLVTGFAEPMVREDFFTLFGVPDSKRTLLLAHLASMRLFIDGPSPIGAAHFFAMAAAGAIFEDVFRRPLPDDAIAARALLLAVGEGALQRDEAIAHAIMLHLANETSAETLAALIARLIERPDIWADLRTGTISVESVVEEGLRLGPPTTHVSLARIARQDVVFEETIIPAGSQILLPLGELNRDPVAFVNPEEFDPARRGPKHLAFGAGPHMCLGTRLARANLRVALQALVDAIDVWPAVAGS